MFNTAFLDLPAMQAAGGTVRLPGSKSISNRVLLLAALATGDTLVHDLLDSDDTRVMLAALRQLGCQLTPMGQSLRVHGVQARFAPGPQDFHMGNAGTAMRPLTAALAVLGGEFTLRGVPRMHERPIGDLVDALRQLGCRIDYLGQDGYPPLRIGQPNLQLQAPIRVRGDVSSQFLTALLMALPLVSAHDIVIEVVGELISKPYIEITLQLMQRFGVTVARDGWRRFTIPAGQRYQSPGEVYVEADASSASYFIALGALAQPKTGSRSIRIEGVGADSIQGDIRFVEAAQRMGAEVLSGPNWLEVSRGQWPLLPIDLDCNHIPDAAMTLAVMALYASGTSTLRNIASWRVKETDRIEAMATELRKLGAQVQTGPDWISVTPPEHHMDWRAASIHTYDDHRVAMCFALASFNPAQLPVRIQDPKCVAKTFPDYFEALLGLTESAPEHIPVLCVDGPTASGKGTLAVALAERLGYHYLDSGALYRVLGLVATRAGLALDLAHEPAIAALAQGLPLRFVSDQVWLGDENISDAIRTESAGTHASLVSALPAVRRALLQWQLDFRQAPGLVADGRDMGTVIFPQAALKVYLTADARQRAERRHKQLISKGISATLDSLWQALLERDARDQSRDLAPLKPAQDAVLLDNSHLSIEESVHQVLAWWQSKQPFQSN